jgi:hypothetical protein
MAGAVIGVIVWTWLWRNFQGVVVPEYQKVVHAIGYLVSTVVFVALGYAIPLPKAAESTGAGSQVQTTNLNPVIHIENNPNINVDTRIEPAPERLSPKFTVEDKNHVFLRWKSNWDLYIYLKIVNGGEASMVRDYKAELVTASGTIRPLFPMNISKRPTYDADNERLITELKIASSVPLDIQTSDEIPRNNSREGWIRFVGISDPDLSGLSEQGGKIRIEITDALEHSAPLEVSLPPHLCGDNPLEQCNHNAAIFYSRAKP